MKERNLLNAMGGIDYRYIADAAPTGRRHKRRNFAMVASVCLMLGAIFIFLFAPGTPSPQIPDVPTDTEPGTPDTPDLPDNPDKPPVVEPPQLIEGSIELIGHTQGPKLTYTPAPPSGSGNFGGGSGAWIPVFGGRNNPIVVQARVTEVLPGLYRDMPYFNTYHVLKMQLLDIVEGQNVPVEFYYCLDDFLPPQALLEYDSLILIMEQFGMEDYTMLNLTTATHEAFSLMFGYDADVLRGCILPISDGRIDTSLWEKEHWNFYGIPIPDIANDTKFDKYLHPVRTWHTSDQAKGAISGYLRRHSYEEAKVLTRADFTSEDATDALAYVRPFVNGVFVTEGHIAMSESAKFIRMINGYQTTEIVHVYPDKVSRHGEAFTAEDLASIPDIHAVIEQINPSSVAPPHTPSYKELTQTAHSTTGLYTKVNGKVYGVVKIVWEFCVPNNPTKTYYDDMYIIAYPDGTYREIDREELRALIVTEDGMNKEWINTQPYNTVIDRGYDQP